MKRFALTLTMSVFLLVAATVGSHARTLDEIRAAGVIRHLGVPYANFVTGLGDGMSVELIRLFAAHLGVRYEFVETSWDNAIHDLTGFKVRPDGNQAILLDPTPVRGDLLANGLTVLPWRQQVLDYSLPTFPTQVWLVSNASSPLRPVKPEDEEKDIAATRKLLRHTRLLGKRNTCLDPGIYPFAEDDYTTIYFSGKLNEMVPAVMQGEADHTLLDVPDALVAIGRWPGRIKVLGPLSKPQVMAVGFRRDNPELRREFNAFYTALKADGSYRELVKKYYPAVFDYYPDFF